MRFSVCMAVYHGDNPCFFKEALDSIVNQSLLPDEIILVVDGPVGDRINDIIREFENKCDYFKVHRLVKNSGHAAARQTGIESAQYEYVAIMDSDDLAERDRFQKQIQFFSENPNYDIVGGQVTEFIDNPSNIIGKRIVPLKNKDIYAYMKSRCAFNQPTVMFKKTSVHAAGGYQDWHWNEDYYLWIRMMLNGCMMANLPDVLVNMRTGLDQYRRRGGRKYFKSEKGIQKLLLDNGLISHFRYCFNVSVRWCVQVAMPNWLRGFIFQNIFRNKTNK